MSASLYDSIVTNVRKTISSNHGIHLASVCLLETRSVPKTTSGKIARSWCRRAFLEKRLKLLKQSDASSNVETGDDLFIDENDVDGKGAPSAVAPLGRASIADEEAPLTEADVRGLSLEEIVARLERLLIIVSNQSGAALLPPIDREAPLSTLGLDSLTVVQFNGALQKRFFCSLPDDFLFSQKATLNELSQSVARGGLTVAQAEFMQSASAAPGGEGERRAAPVVPKRTPLCPWFVCCY